MKRKLSLFWIGLYAACIALSLVPHLLVPPGDTDKTLHVFAFCVLMSFGWLILDRPAYRIAAMIVLFLTGIGNEVLQSLIGGRMASVEDALANGIGILLGALAGYLIRSGLAAKPPRRPFLLALGLMAALTMILPTKAQAQKLPTDSLPTRLELPTVTTGPLVEAAAANEPKQRKATTAPATKQQQPEDPRIKSITFPQGEPNVGIPMGGFVLTPAFETSALFDDNIFRTHSNAKSDIVTSIKPGVTLASDWALHEIEFGALGDFGEYQRGTRDGYTNYQLRGAGRYDVAPETHFDLITSHQVREEGADNNNDITGRGTITYTTNTEEFSFTRALSYIRLKLLGRNENEKLSSDQTLVGETSYQSRHKQTGEIELACEYMPGNRFYARSSFDHSEYAMTSGGTRITKGTDLRLGWAFDTDSLYSGSLYAGHLWKDYDTGIEDLARFYVGGAFSWEITPLTLMILTYDRRYGETTDTNSSGTINTNAQIRLQHSLTQRLSGALTGSYELSDYVGRTDNQTRKAEYVSAGVEGEYRFSDNTSFKMDYEHRERLESDTETSYRNNRLLFSLSYKY